MPKPTDRQYINYLGEYYDDCLTVEAELKNRTKTFEGSSLLCAKLQEREQKRNLMVEYLAGKRNISFQEMWRQLLTKTYTPMTPEEYSQLQELGESFEGE